MRAQYAVWDSLRSQAFQTLRKANTAVKCLRMRTESVLCINLHIKTSIRRKRLKFFAIYKVVS